MMMFTQQSVYILGIVNLVLAGLAIFCVIQAQDHREYFFLIYIAVSIFIFYMATIFTIIILQIMETYQEQRRYDPSSSSFQMTLFNTRISSRSNTVIDENFDRSTKPKIYLSRSQTLPLILSASSHSHPTTSTILPVSKGFHNLSGNLLSAATNHLALLTNHPQTKCSKIHRNYQSFTIVTNDHE